MKKLLIAAAIVCAAAMSQAATVKWTTGKLYAPDAGGNFTSTLLYNNDKMDSISVALTFYAFDGENWNAIPAADIGNTSTAKLGKSGSATATTTGYNFLQDTVYKYSAEYKLTYDGKEYTMSVDPTEFTQNLGSGSFPLSVADAGKWTTSAVPEPTSGLLLLLGVAGLALRRGRRS